MTEPLRPTGIAAQPVPLELEPMIISARPRGAAPDVPVPVGDIALECLSKLDGAAIAIAASKGSPILVALSAFKAGLELGECVAETMNRVEEEASIRQAIERCVEDGGTPLGVVGDDLTCAVPEGT